MAKAYFPYSNQQQVIKNYPINRAAGNYNNNQIELNSLIPSINDSIQFSFGSLTNYPNELMQSFLCEYTDEYGAYNTHRRCAKDNIRRSKFSSTNGREQIFIKKAFIKKASLLTVKRGKEHSRKNLDQESNLDVLVEKKLDAFCVTWSASYDGNRLVNTCSIDNFITLISLHSESIFSTLDYLHVAIEGKLAEFLPLIRQRKFDELRFWIAKELNIKSNHGIFDFYGSEFAFVTLMRHMNLNNKIRFYLPVLELFRYFLSMDRLNFNNKI